MQLLKSHMDQLPLGYQKAIEGLYEAYGSPLGDTSEKKRGLLREFFKKWFMIQPLWDEWFRLLDEDPSIEAPEKKEVAKLAAYHFYHHEEYTKFNKRKLLAARNSYLFSRGFYGMHDHDEYIADLKFPQQFLDDAYSLYEEHTTGPPLTAIKEQYYAMKELYQRIMEAKDDDEEWFKLISQVDDEDFVVYNVEHRLCENIVNVKLWQLYIDYWSQKDKKKMLDICSRYCRFFVDDTEMRKLYYKESQLHGSIAVEWQDTFEFELVKEPKFPTPPPEPPRSINYNLVNYPSCEKVNLDNCILQVFQLPKTLMAYIKRNQTCNIRHKLNQSCKLFFAAEPYPVCYRFIHKNDTWRGFEFDNLSMAVYLGTGNSSDSEDIVAEYKRKVCISMSLHFFDKRRSLLSRTLTSIYSCNAKYISIHNQNLTLKEFTFLVEHGKVESLSLRDTKILTENNDEMKPSEVLSLERILALTPRVIYIEIWNPKITAETSLILSQLPFVNKIRQVILMESDILDHDTFIDFVTQNFADTSDLLIRFHSGLNSEAITYFSVYIKEIIRYYWKKAPKPSVSIC